MLLNTFGFGTGAELHREDPRDHLMDRIPRVAMRAAEGVSPERNWTSLVKFIYNQGALPSCVAHSIAGMQSLYEQMDSKQSIIYDAEAVYWANGGDGQRGVVTATVLKYAKDKGLPEKAGTRLNRIQSYAFTRDINTILAALDSTPPLLVVFAMLLPADFMKGDCTSMTMTQSYHQVLAVGYNANTRRLYFQNSWGSNYGVKGFGSVPFDFLTQQSNQSGHFYAYTTVDVLDGQQLPDPVRVIVGIETLAGIPTIRITSGERYVIRGKGFGARVGRVIEGSVAAGARSVTSIDLWSDTEIRVTAGKFASDFDGVIAVHGPGTTPQETFILTHEGIQFRSGIVTPPPPPPNPNPSITSYQSVATVPIASSAEGREIEVVFDASATAGFLNRPMKVFWGTQELPIVGKLIPNRLRVLLPEVPLGKALSISVVMQDDQTRITGKLLTIRNVR